MINDVNTILSSLDEFETNINDIATVLNNLKSINEGYLESINAPKIVMEKVNALLDEQENRYRNINSQLGKFAKELRGYDKLIEGKVEESINSNLIAINKTTEDNLTEIRQNIFSLKPIVEKNEEIVVKHTKLLEEKISQLNSFSEKLLNELSSSTIELTNIINSNVNMYINEMRRYDDKIKMYDEEKISQLNSFSEKLLNELSSSIIELTTIINSNVNMYINEMRRYDDKIKMYDSTLSEKFNSIEIMEKTTLNLQKQINIFIKGNEAQKLEIEKTKKLANINTGILLSILVIMVILLFK